MNPTRFPFTARAITRTAAVSVVTAGVLALSSTAAFAGFRVDTPEQRPPVHPRMHSAHVAVPEYYKLAGNQRLKYIVTIGQGDPAPVKGFGTAIPLGAATELILPDHWLSYVHPLLDASKPVSWGDDGTWLEVLRGIAIRSDYQLFVDFHNEIVRIDPMPNSSALVQMSDFDYGELVQPIELEDYQQFGDDGMIANEVEHCDCGPVESLSKPGDAAAAKPLDQPVPGITVTPINGPTHE